MKTINAGELSKRIGVHGNTVRNWSGEYAAFLSASAATGQHGKRRRFNDKDVLVLATIADLRAKGLTREQVVEALKAGTRIEVAAAAADVRGDVGVVSVAQLERVLDEVSSLREKLDELRAERDKALEGKEALDARIKELERQLGRAEVRISTRGVLALVIGVAVFFGLVLVIVVYIVTTARLPM